ncbi:fimbrial protein, partial [Salmonella enterica subsp. enterica serovar Give]|nr:fimbrial protein [Salmonella enterica subsp. enterica serovar Give]
NNTVRQIHFLFGALILAFSGLCSADVCEITAPLIRTVSTGNILVQRDTGAGAEIARVRVSGFVELASFSSTGVASCNGGYTFNYLSATPASMSGVYNTNLDGVGIRASFDAGNFMLPSYGANIKTLYYLGNYDVIFYKTGNITSGPLTPGLIAQGWYGAPDNH